MTECTQSRLPFANHGSREVVAEFSGGTMTSDSGALLLRETDGRMKLLARFSQCFLDGRNPALVQHLVEQMLAQRIYGLALGYEDLNDHEQLRQDPLLKLLAGKADLTTEETHHLQDCDDCREDAIEMRRVLQDSADIEKARHFLAEEGKLPLGTEPPKETHEEQRELDETPGT